MEFNLIDSQFHNKPEIGLCPESSESSDFEFSGSGGGSPTSFTPLLNAYAAATPPPTNPSLSLFQETKFPLFAPTNIENNITLNDIFPCTTLSLQKPRDSNMDAMREMIFRMAMMQPVEIDPESVKPPRRKNVRISKDPQSVAARHRRERISQRIRILQRMVPGGTKLDTASMLEEAAHYVKFLKKQVQSLEQAAVGNRPPMATAVGLFPVVGSMHVLN